VTGKEYYLRDHDPQVIQLWAQHIQRCILEYKYEDAMEFQLREYRQHLEIESNENKNNSKIAVMTMSKIGQVSDDFFNFDDKDDYTDNNYFDGK
jgi:hypothetical protein